MKICFVLEYYFPHIGGAETFFENLAERLAEGGHECFVVTTRLSGTKKYEKIKGVNVWRVNTPRLLDRYWFTFLSIPYVYKIAKECDILHTMTYNGAFSAFFASKILNKPSVITVFEALLDLWKTLSGMNWFNARFHAVVERMVLGLPFNKYACISYYTRNYARLLGISDKKLTMIYPGVDQNLFSYQEENGRLIREKLKLKDNFIYLYFGRPGFFKGVEFLLQAVPLISKAIPKAKLLLILSKEPKGKYKQMLSLIRNLQIRDSVVLLENVHLEDLVKYISGCDCVVLPSLSEGFGFSCVEACSVGKPVVATDIGSIPEVIFGKYVYITPRSPEGVCQGVQEVYSGKVMFRPRKAFNWGECVEKYKEMYFSLLKG